jgi:membrane-associated phospholipid phosphatase
MCLLTSTSYEAQAQFFNRPESPYQLRWQNTTPVIATAGFTLGLSRYWHHSKPVLTPEKINNLRAEDVWAFERFVTNNWSVPAQKTSDWFMIASLAAPALLLSQQKARRDIGNMGVIIFQNYLVSMALTSLTKESVRRIRPFVYNPNAPLVKKTARDATASFISGHTSSSAVGCFTAAQLYHDYYPNSPYRPYVWATAALVPAITGYLRVRGGKHFLTDVVVGYIVGAAAGILLPRLYYRPQ